MKEKVTVILPVYNGASRGNGVFLRQAIESVLNQDYSNIELIIVNDGSNDNTEEVCLSYKDKQIKYFYQNNQGLSAARNKGLKESTGDYIVFIDDDDIFYKNKISIQVQFLKENRCNVVYSFVDKIDENNNVISQLTYDNQGSIKNILLSRNYINSPLSIMITKRVVKDIGFFKEYLKSSEDWDYWIRISEKFKFHCLKEKIAGYRVHNNASLSKNREKMEFYDYIVLMENIFGISPNEQKKYLFQMYKHHMKIDFGVSDFERFRRNYIFAKAYGKHNLLWKTKYLLSHFPNLLSKLRNLK